MPAVRLESLRGIIAEPDVGGAVDRHLVVVVDADEAAKPKMAGERGGLVADSLGKVTVAADRVNEMVDDVGSELGTQPCLGERHANGGRGNPARAVRS